MTKSQGIAVIALSGACFFLGWRLSGQTRGQNAPHPLLATLGMSLQELQLLRHDLRKQKQKLIAENLPLTESEAIKFWHVYQQYSDELKGINDEKFAMIHAYAQNSSSMSNDDALIFIRRWLEVDEKVIQLRSKYVTLVKDTLPGKKAATFFQLDERISMMINLEFASQMPLLHGTAEKRQTTSPTQ